MTEAMGWIGEVSGWLQASDLVIIVIGSQGVMLLQVDKSRMKCFLVCKRVFDRVVYAFSRIEHSAGERTEGESFSPSI